MRLAPRTAPPGLARQGQGPGRRERGAFLVVGTFGGGHVEPVGCEQVLVAPPLPCAGCAVFGVTGSFLLAAMAVSAACIWVRVPVAWVRRHRAARPVLPGSLAAGSTARRTSYSRQGIWSSAVWKAARVCRGAGVQVSRPVSRCLASRPGGGSG